MDSLGRSWGGGRLSLFGGAYLFVFHQAMEAWLLLANMAPREQLCALLFLPGDANY